MGLGLIDTHSHLYADEFIEDFDDVVARLKSADVRKVLLPNIDSGSIPRMKEIVAAHPNLFVPMMGLHPCSVQDNYKDELAIVEAELQSNTYCAVGEVGMDLYWDQSTKAIQEIAFRQQCEWAAELKLPLAIHSRNSTREILDILQDLKSLGLKGVFHCFSGTKSEANELIDLGFYLGIGGVVTVKNSGLKEEIKEVGLENILLETDSPYLAPTPYRGKRNETSYVKLVADFLAEWYDLPQEEIYKRTSENAVQLFGL
jgi:TatD DNase family protein